MDTKTISDKIFSELLIKLADFRSQEKIAVAVSGGGDSMALAFLLSRFALKNKISLHIISVDHGLRKESSAEAKQVGAWVREWPSVTYKTLKWVGEKPKTGIQEAARVVRYRLMSEYCRKQKIKYLFIAHHADDQMETFLFRLAKGSGMDGLSCMQSLQKTDGGVTLVRPLLNHTHKELLAVCQKNKIEWIEDPSNHADKFARVRLRQSKEILEGEGLTSERIIQLSKRFERIRSALDQITDNEWKNCILHVATHRIEMDLKKYLLLPKEVGIRILQRAIVSVGGAKKYPPKLLSLEAIVDGIFDTESFRAASLAGCIIRRRKTKNLLEITLE